MHNDGHTHPGAKQPHQRGIRIDLDLYRDPARKLTVGIHLDGDAWQG